jgi:phosphoribosyl 1,2-cyclic phosphate phosphodiesterase
MHRDMPVLGFRMGDFTYITDANSISAEAMEQIKGSKVLILNALRPQSHPTHFTLSEAIALTQSLNIPQTYFTHFSHQIGLQAEVEPSLPKGIGMAYDGMVITV